MIFYDNEETQSKLSLVWKVLDLHCACYRTVQTLDPCFAGAPCSAFDALQHFQCVPFQEPKPVQEEVATPKSGLGLCLFVEVYNED